LDRSLGIGRKIETICFRPLPHRREQSQIAGTENDFGRLAVILQSAQNVAE
jgi:hypothetical protein